MLKKINRFLLRLLNNLFNGNPPTDRDPYAGVPVRNKRSPNDRTTAVMVAEPDDE